MGKTLNETVDILQGLHANLDGINWAPYIDAYPRGEVARSNLPCVMVIPGEGNWSNPFGIGCRSDDRQYTVTVLYADTGTGINTDFFPGTLDLIDEFGELYNGNSINTESGGDLHLIIQDELPLDTGLEDEVIHADTRYYGFSFTIRLWRKASTS